MAISIDWGTRIITIPKVDTTLIQLNPMEIRELNLNTFRLALKSLEDSEEGMLFPITHNHNTEVTLGSLTFARVIEIVNDYTITFEDGQYAVNLVGANSNVADKVNVNQVSIRSYNSAGLIVTDTGGGGGATPTEVAEAVVDQALAGHVSAGTVGEALSSTGVDVTLIRKILKNRLKLQEGSANNYILYDDDGITPLLTWDMTDVTGSNVILPRGSPVERMPT